MSAKQNGWALQPKALVSVFYATRYIVSWTHKTSVRRALLSVGSPSLPQKQEHEAVGDAASAVGKETTMKAVANFFLFKSGHTNPWHGTNHS